MKYGQTLVPNIFIDNYLALASGEYVKVYIMLLRIKDEEEFSISSLADMLEFTEKDVIRAIAYWEKQGLLSVEYSDGAPVKLEITMDAPKEESVKIADEDKELKPKQEDAASKVINARPEATKTAKTATKVMPKIVSKELGQLVYVAEQYLGRTLTKTDTSVIVWLFEDSGFSVELIEFLLEYCTSLGKKNPAYIRAVAENWQKIGIKDVEAARKQIADFSGAKKKGAKGSGNAFHNFAQRGEDLNALVNKEYQDVAK